MSQAGARRVRRYGRGEACITLGLSLQGVGGAGTGDLVLLGSAVNQDGRSSSLTAPYGPSQQQACTPPLRAAHNSYS